MNQIWKFKDGLKIIECTSFPYAFRTMYNAIKKGMEKDGRKYEDMIKQMYIISPHQDKMGNNKIYTYEDANQTAKNMGLLTPDGQLNSKEFKR